jgi:hypothetical protein
MYSHDVRHYSDRGDASNVSNEIVTEVLIQRCVDGVWYRGQEKRISIRRRVYDHLGADVAPGAGPILNDEWLG